MYFATIAGFSQLLNIIITNISEIRAKNINIQGIKDFLYLENDENVFSNTNLSNMKPPYSIIFDNVSFKYPNTEKLVLNKLSLTIKEGEKLALVGGNGEGKTTFIKLLTRLYKPSEGYIYINGININDISQKHYCKILSVVFQDYKILAFSAADNITLEDPITNYDKLIDAMKSINIYDKIQSLPKKEDTSMLKNIDDQAVELSQGEKQRLAIARALYKDGGIIILDEPTASLSPQAEEQVYKILNNIAKDKICIFISHRLSSTKFCDNIAFIKNGMISEYGTHEQLIALDKEYARMYKIQAQYYK